jgi:hypothetical protein
VSCVLTHLNLKNKNRSLQAIEIVGKLKQDGKDLG